MASFLIPDDFITQGDHQQRDLVAHNIPLNLLCVHDSMLALPGTAANDDLGITAGTMGSASPSIVSSDGAQTTVTQYARFQYCLPPEYAAGQSVTLRIYAGMATVSDDKANVDVQAYEPTAAGVTSTDICETAAQSINSATLAAKDFVITPTELTAGDMIDVRITVAIDDTATGSGVTAKITQVGMLLDIRG